MRLETRIRPDIGAKKIRRSAIAECGGNSLQAADALFIMQNLPQLCQAAAMHEHDSVHELHLPPPANAEHPFELSNRVRARFFAEHMFAGLGSAVDPLRSDTGWQGDINRVDIA